MHVPKTGGTSIESNAMKYNISWGYLLFNQLGLDDENTREQLCDKMDICTPFVWHVPLSKWIKYFSLPNITNKNNMSLFYDLNRVEYFCVVRHPFMKMISEYKYLIQFRQKQKWIHNNTGKDYCNEYALNTWIQNALTDYKQTLINNPKHYCNTGCHFVAQYDFVYDSFGNKLCKHIVHYENLNKEIGILFREYNLEEMANTLANVHQMVNAQCTDAMFSVQNLTKDTKRVIYNMYKKDFEAFEYQFM